MKNTYLIIEDDTIAERATSNGKEISMRYSKSEIWNESAKEKFVGSLKDNGNKIKIKLFNKKIDLEYNEFCYLYNLMQIKISEDDNMIATTEILKLENED